MTIIPTGLTGIAGTDVAGAATDAAGPAKPTSGFGEMLRTKLGALDELQQSGDAASQALATGKTQDVAQSMLAMERANIALELTMTIRNKAIEAYQEVLRMQV